MAFKENLLEKIEMDALARKIKASWGIGGSEKRMDRGLMRRLLEKGPFTHRKERDLDLYLFEAAGGERRILVLDNDLPFYRTTVEDVAMRKSPTVKEMISIKNAMKILNDGDVVVSKKSESLETVREACVATLDLSFQPEDIEEMEKDGTVSLDQGYADGVLESLKLFGELLKYDSAPKVFRLSRYQIIGRLEEGSAGEIRFGPLVLYSMIHNTLHLMDSTLSSIRKEDALRVKQVAVGKEKPAAEGEEVFAWLREAVLKKG